MQAKCNEKISSENSSIPFMHYRGLDQFKMMKCSSPESQGHKMDLSQPIESLHSWSLTNQSVTSADDTHAPPDHLLCPHPDINNQRAHAHRARSYARESAHWTDVR